MIFFIRLNLLKINTLVKSDKIQTKIFLEILKKSRLKLSGFIKNAFIFLFYFYAHTFGMRSKFRSVHTLYGCNAV